jgi:gamma-glutamyltranspeptidase/glutathione hydrolase
LMSSRSFRNSPNDCATFFPRLQGTRGACTSMHNLSAIASHDILVSGGNAVDAAVASVLVEGLVNPQMNTIGGECPILIKMADSNEVVAINGNTAAPQTATPKFFLSEGWSDMPDTGILAAGVPATLASLLLALGHFGRLRFEDVAQDPCKNRVPCSPRPVETGKIWHH